MYSSYTYSVTVWLQCSYNVAHVTRFISFHFISEYRPLYLHNCSRIFVLLNIVFTYRNFACSLFELFFENCLKNKIFWYGRNYFTWLVQLQLCYLCHCDTYKREHYRCFLYSIWKGSTCSFKNAKEMWMWNI